MALSALEEFAQSLHKIEWTYFVDSLRQDPGFLLFSSFYPDPSGKTMEIRFAVNNDWYGQPGGQGFYLNEVRLILGGSELSTSTQAPFLNGKITTLTNLEVYKDVGFQNSKVLTSETIRLPSVVQGSKVLASLSTSIGSDDTFSPKTFLSSLGVNTEGLALDKTLITLPMPQISASSSDLQGAQFGLNTSKLEQDLLDSNPAHNTVAKLLGQGQANATGLLDIADGTSISVNASTWSNAVLINRVSKAAVSGESITAKQVDLKGISNVGSALVGNDGNDVLRGLAGWDLLDGGRGNDLIKGGNGRDIITGNIGNDELHGDFGWNTFTSERDGFADLLCIKSDQYLYNWNFGKAGNNANGERCDIIEGLDSGDRIYIIGIKTEAISFTANTTHKGVTGIGIYAGGALEALYIGGDLSIAQLTAMTSGDASEAAMNNQIFSYGWAQHPGSLSPQYN